MSLRHGRDTPARVEAIERELEADASREHLEQTAAARAGDRQAENEREDRDLQRARLRMLQRAPADRRDELAEAIAADELTTRRGTGAPC